MPLMKMRLKEWRTVAAWTWQDMNTECPICQKRLDSTWYAPHVVSNPLYTPLKRN